MAATFSVFAMSVFLTHRRRGREKRQRLSGMQRLPFPARSSQRTHHPSCSELAAGLDRILQTERHERANPHSHPGDRQLPRSVRCLEDLSRGAAVAHRRLHAASLAARVRIARFSAASGAAVRIKHFWDDGWGSVRRPPPRDKTHRDVADGEVWAARGHHEWSGDDA